MSNHPLRPRHPDMGRIGRVLIAADEAVDAERHYEHKEAAWHAQVSSAADYDSLTWIAFQRSLLLVGVPGGKADENIPDSGLSIEQQARLTTFWLDAFVAGVNFQKAGGHIPYGEDHDQGNDGIDEDGHG